MKRSECKAILADVSHPMHKELHRIYYQNYNLACERLGKKQNDGMVIHHNNWNDPNYELWDDVVLVTNEEHNKIHRKGKTKYTSETVMKIALKAIGRPYKYKGMTVVEALGEEKARIRTEKFVAKMKGRTSFKKGKTLEEIYGKEKAEQLKEQMKPHCYKKGNKPWNTGKKYTYEDIFGEEKAKEIKEQLSKRMSGKNNHMYGVVHPKEILDRIAEKNRGRTHYNNGIIEICATECPEGFVKGRLSVNSPRGARNPHSLTYLIIDPDGNEYNIIGGLRDFCLEHNISFDMCRRNFNKGVIKPSDRNYDLPQFKIAKNTLGWEVRVLKGNNTKTGIDYGV